MLQKITLGAGCFWCIEAAFASVRGIEQAVSGYMGGSAEHANYRSVCSGETEHVEVVQLTYDDQQIDIQLIFEMFLFLHDPTSVDKQGNDIGSQYRSVWFFHDSAQQQIAEQMIQHLNSTAAFATKPIVTQVQPAESFFTAESYHQGYFSANPQQPYCALLVAPKLQKFRHEYAAHLKHYSL